MIITDRQHDVKWPLACFIVLASLCPPKAHRWFHKINRKICTFALNFTHYEFISVERRTLAFHARSRASTGIESCSYSCLVALLRLKQVSKPSNALVYPALAISQLDQCLLKETCLSYQQGRELQSCIVVHRSLHRLSVAERIFDLSASLHPVLKPMMV